MRPQRAFIALAIAVASLAAPACDPVHTDAVSALGDDPTGARTGPTHRPGQPCLVCHDGKLGDPNEFSVAGTIYLHPSDTVGLSGVRVLLTGADGTKANAVTNQAGNFYLTPNQWTPSFPMQAQIEYGNQTITMATNVGRDGSCSSCHVEPAGPGSPGRVSVSLEDGGALP